MGTYAPENARTRGSESAAERAEALPSGTDNPPKPRLLRTRLGSSRAHWGARKAFRITVRKDGRLAALQLAEELARLFAARVIGLLARRVSDLAPVVADLFHRQAAFAQVDALGLDDASEREGAGAGGQDTAGGRLVRAQEDHARRYVFGLQPVEDLLRHAQVLGHAGGGDRAHGIDVDIVLLALELQRVHEADDAELGGAVV